MAEEHDRVDQHFCTFCETGLFEESLDGLCVWCRAGFPPSYAAWMTRARRDAPSVR